MEKPSNIHHISSSFKSSINNKMSSISLSTINAKIDALLGEVALLRAAASSAPVAVSSPGKKAVAEKKPRKKSDAPPTPWRLFTDRVRGVLTAAEFKGVALGVECVQFCASLKDENADLDSWTNADILARRADWTKPEVSRGEAKHGKGWAKTGDRRVAAKTASVAGSVAGSVVSGGEEAEPEADGGAPPSTEKKARKNPWAGLTPEQKAVKVAGMKAGKAAKKTTESSTVAAADDAASAAVAPSSPALVASSSSMTSSKPAAPSAPAAASSSTEFKGVMIGGARYLVNLESGHCYNREKDGSQGEWAGLFHRTGGPKNGPYIDTEVAEPSDDAAEAAEDLVFE
jgi:hypothetical protein